MFNKKVFKVGNLIRHQSENSSWLWEIISIQPNTMVNKDKYEYTMSMKLVNTPDNTWSNWTAGYFLPKELCHECYILIKECNTKKNHLPTWF